MKTKTTLAVALLAAATLSAHAQSYVIQGTGATSTVYLRNLQSRAADSVAVAAGAFTFQGDAQEHLFALVQDKQGKRVPVVLEGTVQVNLAEGTASGSAENEGLTTWNARFAPVHEGMAALMAEYQALREGGKALAPADEARIDSTYEALTAQIGALTKACCKENEGMKFPAFFLAQNAAQMEKADVIALAENDPAYMRTGIMQRTRAAIEGWKHQMPGQPVVDIEMADTTGTMHHLTEYVGKGSYVLVDFWASWCGPCRQEMPAVKKAYARFHDKGFDIVGLSFDNSHKAWTAAIKKLDLPWTHLSDLKGWESLAGRTYGINSIPATLLFDPQGRVVAAGLRGEDIEKKLEELIK